MWVPACSWFFNIYVITSYTFLIGVRRYQAAKIDELEDNRRVQIIMMGILMPLFNLHTYFGGQQFFASPLKECRTVYQGEVLYIVMFLFSVSMSFVFGLLLLCVLIPTWINNFFGRRRRRNRYADVQERLDALNNYDDEANLN